MTRQTAQDAACSPLNTDAQFSALMTPQASVLTSISGLRKLPIYQVDAFATERFTGNAAAVVRLPNWLPEKVMQQIAAENNVAETAFFVQDDKGYAIRWFSPTVEIDLCGHATLATAYVIMELLGGKESELLFQSKSGPLRVFRTEEQLVLDFPSTPAQPVSDTNEIDRLSTALGLRPKLLLKSRDYLAVFDRADDIVRMQPDFSLLKKMPALGIIVTAPGMTDFDYVCRFFAPAAGIDEDPATGSAQCTLAPYWSARLRRNSLQAFQASARGGEFNVEMADHRVRIGGQCHLFLEGTIYV